MLPRFTYAFLSPIPFRKIRFLGGKFGANVEEEWNQTNVSDLWNVSLEKMRERFGSDGQWLYQLLRGIDSSAVQQRSANHSMMSVKNFRPRLTSSKMALSWLAVLSSELSKRLQEEREDDPSMFPRTLVLRYLISNSSGVKSHQVPFGQIANEHLDREIYTRAEKLWYESIGRVMHRPGPSRVELSLLALSFASIDRTARDQQPLRNFLSPQVHNKRKADMNPEERMCSKSVRTTKQNDYEIVKDEASLTDMAQWTCSICSHTLHVPIFEDPESHCDNTERPSFLQILAQARMEHEHWHMAMKLAEM